MNITNMTKGSAAWQQKRRQVIERSGGICEECHKRPGAHVHHERYLERGRGGEPLEWLLHLCLRCHQAKHPHHEFLTMAEQRERARRKKGQRKKKKPKMDEVLERERGEQLLAEPRQWNLRERMLGPEYWGRT